MTQYFICLSLLVVLTQIACRPRHADPASLASDETPKSKLSDRIDTSFEWLKSESPEGKKTAERHLTFCVDKSLAPFSQMIQDVANSINEHFKSLKALKPAGAEGWSLSLTPSCPENFNLLERNPGLQPHIRFRAAQERDSLASQPVNKAYFVRIFDDIYSQAVVVVPPRTSYSPGALGLADPEVDDDNLFTANIPDLALAAIRSENPLRDGFLVSADLIINTHKNVPWVIPNDVKLPTEHRTLDARLLTMNLWGRILKLKPRLKPLSNVENICSKPAAPSSESALYIYLRVGKFCLNQKNFDSLENRYQYSSEDWQDLEESSRTP